MYMRRHSQEWIRSLDNNYRSESNDGSDREKAVADLTVAPTAAAPALPRSASSSSSSSSSPLSAAATALARTASLSAITRASKRRSTISLAIPWRPNSDPSLNSNSSSNGSTGLSPTASPTSPTHVLEAQRRLADLLGAVPAGAAASCPATPPQTPPESSASASLTYPSQSSAAALNEISRSASSTTIATTTPTSSSSSSSSSSSAAVAGASSVHCSGEYACSLERDILWQGTLSVTATQLCFYGKHFGKAVRVIIDFRDLVSVQRETATATAGAVIRIRVHPILTSAGTASAINNTYFSSSFSSSSSSSSNNTTSSKQIADGSEGGLYIKEYILTGFINDEQAFTDIERNRVVYRQVMRNLLDETLPSPTDRTQSESSNQEEQSHEGRRRRRRKMRSYSVVTREEEEEEEEEDGYSSFSATIGNTLLLGESVSVNADTFATDTEILESLGSLRRSAPRRRNSSNHAGTGAAGHNNNNNNNGYRSYNDTLRQHRHFVSSSEDLLLPEDRHYQDEDGDSFATVRMATTSTTVLAAPIPIKSKAGRSSTSSSSASVQGRRFFKSPTPPPSLLSPSLTTTKVSRSSSTVHGVVGQSGAMPGMVVHVRNGSESSKLDEQPGASSNGGRMQVPAPVLLHGQQDRSQPESTEHPGPLAMSSSPDRATFSAAAIPQIQIEDPSGPVTCRCERHCKNAILSTVVPMSLERCFEVLFSGQGAGQGSGLICRTHQVMDGSTDVKISPWEKENALLSEHEERKGASGNVKWEGERRRLEYTVAFKMPMFVKTSAACTETQQVLQYSDHVIRILSESRTPSVPFGEQFSTVNQVCLTWVSPGNTRIKCFTEVVFKRSILLSNKVEASSLEGSSGFYKEFIRQLVEFNETLQQRVGGELDAVASTSAASVPSLDSPASNTANDSTVQGLVKGTDAAHKEPLSSLSSTSLLCSREPPLMRLSAAHLLLSQQFLNNPPTRNLKRGAGAGARLSMDITRPAQPAPPLPSAVVDPLWSATDLKDLKTSNTAIATLWWELSRRSMALFNKSLPEESSRSAEKSESEVLSATDKTATAATPAKGAALPGNSAHPEQPEGDDVARKHRRSGSMSSSLLTIDSSCSYCVATAAGVKSTFVPGDKTIAGGQTASGNPTAQSTIQSHPRSSSTIRMVVFVMSLVGVAMAISVLNLWYLSNAVSSVVEIVQAKNGQLAYDRGGDGMMDPTGSSSDSGNANVPEFPSAQDLVGGAKIRAMPTAIQRHLLKKQASLVPLQIQTEMLRAEILELKAMLDSIAEKSSSTQQGSSVWLAQQ